MLLVGINTHVGKRRGPPSMLSSTAVVAATGPTSRTPRGPPLMSSSASVVAAIGPAGSTPQGACHRRLLQLRRWPLPDPPAALPKGPDMDIFFNFGGDRCRTHRQHPPRGPTLTTCNKWQLLLDSSANTSQGGTVVNTIATVHATSKTFLRDQFFLKSL
jgi:hypothetical protein